MTEIPEDVMKAAALAHAEFADSKCRDNLGVIIARAILAERERCAACQPSTAEDPNDSAYQRGRFDQTPDIDAVALEATRRVMRTIDDAKDDARWPEVRVRAEIQCIIAAALRARAATPAASTEVPDEMVEVAATAVRNARNPYITPWTEGADYDRRLARAAIEAALKVKEAPDD